MGENAMTDDKKKMTAVERYTMYAIMHLIEKKRKSKCTEKPNSSEEKPEYRDIGWEDSA